MEDIINGVTNLNISDSHKKNRIEVFNTKNLLFFLWKSFQGSE